MDGIISSMRYLFKNIPPRARAVLIGRKIGLNLENSISDGSLQIKSAPSSSNSGMAEYRSEDHKKHIKQLFRVIPRVSQSLCMIVSFPSATPGNT